MSKKKHLDWDELDEQLDAWAKKVDKKHKDVNWEKLCGQLEEALENEIKESKEKDDVIRDLVLVIHYLELKLGIYNGNEPV
jgi:hypothetical protein